MANEMKIAEQMAQYAANTMKSVEATARFLKSLTSLFLKYMEQEESRELVMKFYKEGLGQEDRLKPGEKLSIFSYEIQPEYAKQLRDICERDGIACMNAKSNTFDLVMDGKGDNVKKFSDSMWIYNTQQKQFHAAVAEAKARSGYEQEIPREMADVFIGSLKKDGNRMLEVKDIPIEQYISIRQDIQKLNMDMRFTLFPKYHERNGQTYVDAGFLSKTERLYDRKGNVYKSPRTYNIPEMMKALIAKQKVMEKSEIGENHFTQIHNKEAFKQRTIDELLKNKAVTVTSIRRDIEESGLSMEEKQKLDNLLRQYAAKRINKEQLEEEVDKLEIPETAKRDIKEKVGQIGKELYIIPMAVSQGREGMEYVADLKDSICIGRDMVIREAGKDDLLIEDETSIRNNLDRKMTEYSERKSGSNLENSFVVLTADEYKKLEMGNPAVVGSRNRLKKQNIRFLKENEKEFEMKPAAEMTKDEKIAAGIIDTINKNKDRFMLESDKTEVDLGRFEEYHESTIENIIHEQNHKEEIHGQEEEVDKTEAEVQKDENESKLLEAVEEASAVTIEIAASEKGFDEIIEEEMAPERSDTEPEIETGITDPEFSL